MVVTQDGLGGAVDAVSRSVSGGLLLPFLAYAIGNVCFKNVKNHLRRVVLVSEIVWFGQHCRSCTDDYVQNKNERYVNIIVQF